MTSAKTQATSWDIHEYNRFVQAAAKNASGDNAALAGIADRFRAMVSTLIVDAYDNTWTDRGGIPVYWAGGDKAADYEYELWGRDAANTYRVNWDSVDAKTESGADYYGQFFNGSSGSGRLDVLHFAGEDQVRVGKFTANCAADAACRHVWGLPGPDARKPSTESLPLLAISPVIRVLQPPTVTLHLSPASISENGGRTTVTARQDRRVKEDTTLEVEALSASGDLNLPDNLTLTIPAFQTESSGSLIVTANDNDVHAPDKPVTVRIKDGTLKNAHVGAVAGDPATLTIEEDEPLPVLTMTLDNNGRISENGGQARLTASLDRPSSEAVTVTLSAPESGHYNLTATSVTIAAGATATAPASVAFLTAVDNNAYGPSRSVVVSAVASGGNGVRSPSPFTVVIEENDPAPKFRLRTAPVSEGDRARVYGDLIDPGNRSYWVNNFPGGVRLKLKIEPVSVHATGRDVGFYGDTLTLGRRTPVHGNGQFDYVDLSTRENSRDEIDKRFRVSATFVDGDGNPITDKALLRQLGADPAPVVLTVRDDDCCADPKVTLTLTSTSRTYRYGNATIPNNGGTATVTAKLDTPSASDVTVRITVKRIVDGYEAEELVDTNAATISNNGVITIPAEQLEDSGDSGTLTITANNTSFEDARLPLRVIAEAISEGKVISTHSRVLILTK